MQHLIEVGIFDDFDVAPTSCIALFVLPSDVADGPTFEDDRLALASCLAELREAAEHEYGRKAPDHAFFWSCYPHPDDVEIGGEG